MKLLAILLTIILGDMPNATIHQDSTITHLMEQKISGIDLSAQERSGYRVQIYSSNRQQQAKSEALQLEKTMSGQISEKIYVQYAPPFWKVRFGDYISLDDANAAKEEFIRKFPHLQSSTYVVKDKVFVRE